MLARFCLLISLAVGVFSGSLGTRSNVSITTTSTGGVFAPGDLIFQDEFDYLNTNVWKHEVNVNGGYNNEFQVYDKDNANSYVRDGVLYIKPTLTLDKFGGNTEYLYNGYLKLEECTGYGASECEKQASYPYILPPAYSARLRTLGAFSFRYGKIQVRAQLPSGDYTWPAIWLLPEESRYGQWPRSGEIDLMEARGNRQLYDTNGVNIGSEQTASTLHFGPAEGYNGHMLAHGSKNTAPGQGFDRDFHVYELEWAYDHMRFSVDGQEYKSIYPPNGGFFELGQFPNNVPNIWNGAENFKMAPFDQNFHFILNVAVGGDYFPNLDGRPWPDFSPQAYLDFWNAKNSWNPSWSGENAAMKIDYIRVYAI